MSRSLEQKYSRFYKFLLMYLRGQQLFNQSSVLQLTGQLMIHLSPQNSQNYSEFHFRHSEEQHNKQNRKIQLPQNQKHNQNDAATKLEQRVDRIEDMLTKNIQKVNRQTLQTFQNIRSQLNNSIITYGQNFSKRAKQFTDIQRQSEIKNQENFLKQQEQLEKAYKKLERFRSQIQKEMQLNINKMFQEEKVKAEIIRQQKFTFLSSQLMREQRRSVEKNEYLEQKLRVYIQQSTKRIEKNMKNEKIQTNNTIEKLEERIKEKIMEEVSRIDVISNKVTELQQEKNLTDEKLQNIRDKRALSTLIDQTTPHAKRFQILENKITLQDQVPGSYHQILGETVLRKEAPFILHAKIIRTKSGQINIGITDRLLQKESRYSRDSGNSVCFSGLTGEIYHKSERKVLSVKAHEGMEVSIEVDLGKGKARFTVKKHGGQADSMTIESNLLTQKNRQFVPFFDMMRKGDSIVWGIQ